MLGSHGLLHHSLLEVVVLTVNLVGMARVEAVIGHPDEAPRWVAVAMARVEAVIGHPDEAPRRGFDSYTDVLTEKGCRKPLARRCLAFFDRLG